jgi:hypothetical protein
MSQPDNRNFTRLEVVVAERKGVTLSLQFDVEYSNFCVFPEPARGSKYRAVEFLVQVGKDAHRFHSFERAVEEFNAESALSAS